LPTADRCLLTADRSPSPLTAERWSQVSDR